MMNNKLFYELSLEADNDLCDIFDYTEHEFGNNQAVEYISDFEDIFNNLLETPQIGRDRKEIRKGLRSIIKDKHIVFYRILDNRIRIIRVLHGSRDLSKIKIH